MLKIKTMIILGNLDTRSIELFNRPRDEVLLSKNGEFLRPGQNIACERLM